MILIYSEIKTITYHYTEYIVPESNQHDLNVLN